MLSLETLERKGIISLGRFPEKNKLYFVQLWNHSVEKDLPFIQLYKRDKSLGTISLNDLKFSNLYTGARYLSELTSLRHFNSSEILLLGGKIWENAVNEGITLTTQSYFLTPSLFFEAQNTPDKINNAKNIFYFSESAISDQLTHREMVQQINKSIMQRLCSFKDSFTKWNEMSKDFKEVNNEKYKELIEKIRDSFSELDKYLIIAALNSAPDDEKYFIFSPDAIVNPVTINKKRKHIKMIITPFYGRQCYEKKVKPISCNSNLSQPVTLNQTDLFSIRTKDERRIYALKNKNDGYKVFRVDRDISKYIKLELLNSDEIKNAYLMNQNEMKIGGANFYFEFDNEESFSREKTFIIQLIDYLINKHSEDLYTLLYRAGYHPSTLEKMWNILKHFVPLYDCLHGVLDNNIERALTSCVLDALIISPVFTGSLNIVEKFSLYSAKAIRETGILLHKNSMYFISSKSALIKEINFSVINNFQKKFHKNVNLGFQLSHKRNKKFTNNLINYLNKDQETVSLAQKIGSITSKKRLFDFSDSYITARLPDSEIRVPVRKIGKREGKDIYTVINADTSPIIWGGFTLKQNNQLVLLEPSPLSISKSLRKIITQDMYVKDVNIHALSRPDYMGLRWDSHHASAYINYENNWLKINILNDQLFLISEKEKIPLTIHNYKLRPEGFFHRIARLQKQGFSGENLTVTQVIANKLKISEKEANDLLNRYEFPENSNHYSKNTFALWIEKTGQIPSWAEAFQVLDRANYISRFRSGDIQYNGLRSFLGGEGFVYRVDRTSPDIILHHGFTPTEDYGALEKMIPEDEPGLTVAGDLVGALRYNKWVKSPYIYKIKLENIRGVSLKENLMSNSHHLNYFWEKILMKLIKP